MQTIEATKEVSAYDREVGVTIVADGLAPEWEQEIISIANARR